MNTDRTVPSSNKVSGDMVPGYGLVMINDVFYCDFAQELFSLMIAMARTSSSSGNYDKKITSAHLHFFNFGTRFLGWKLLACSRAARQIS